MEISILSPVCLCTRAYFLVTLILYHKIQKIQIGNIMIYLVIQIKKFEGVDIVSQPSSGLEK